MLHVPIIYIKYENTEIILKKYMLYMQKILQHLLIITCLTSY